MASEKLKEAIEVLDEIAKRNDPHWLGYRISVVLAAARAYACEECGGSGRILEECRGSMVGSYPCCYCKADREVADGKRID